MTLYDLLNVVAGVVIVSGALLLYLLPAYPEKRKQKPLTSSVQMQSIEGTYRGVVMSGFWWNHCHEVEATLAAGAIKFRIAFEDGVHEWEYPLRGGRPMTESEMLRNVTVTDERFDRPEVSGFVFENQELCHLWYIRYTAAEGRSAYLFVDMGYSESLRTDVMHDSSAAGQAKFAAELRAFERKAGARYIYRLPIAGKVTTATA